MGEEDFIRRQHMKNLFILFVLILMVTVCTQSQVLVRDRPFLASFHLVNSVNDTSVVMPLISGGSTIPTWIDPGSLADSILIVHRASSDSVKSDVYYQLSYDAAGTNWETAVAIDSIVAGAGRYSCVTHTVFQGAINIRFYIAPRAAGNSTIVANQSTTVFIRELFKASPQANK
jgi:hypothetical protein